MTLLVSQVLKIFFKEEGTNERTDRQMESVPPPMNDCNLGDARALSTVQEGTLFS